MEYWAVKNYLNTNKNQYQKQKEINFSETLLSKLIKVKTNRLDIVIKNYKRKICLLIDMSNPTDNNISVKEYSK